MQSGILIKMEHQKVGAGSKPISKVLKFLPRATSSLSFQNPQIYSPVKDKKPSEKPHKSNLGIGFSDPTTVFIAPADRKLKNNDALVYEPTSPRVSCMGQVKCKHYRKLAAAAATNATTKPAKKITRATSFTPVKTYKNEEDEEKITKVLNPMVTKSNKKTSGIRSLLGGGSGGSRRKSDADQLNAPSLGKMKRFSSGRDAFMNFDWTTHQVRPLEYCPHQRSDEAVMMPSSATVMERNKLGICDIDIFVRVGDLEPRKEINLWKRRTMAQPKPLRLQLHVAKC